MNKTASWSKVRAKGEPSERSIARHRERFDAEERACRLREVREEQDVTQKELAGRMVLTQPTVSALESGDLDRSGLATLRAYVEALAGSVEITAPLGERKVILSDGHHSAE